MSIGNEGNRNEEVGIRILTLNDCDYCNWLKSELGAEGIAYVDIDADEHDDFSTAIEQKFKTNTYPIVFIDLGPSIVTIVGETELETSNTLRTFDTIPQLVGIIKQYIK
jgi:glutaredoxin